MGDKLKSLLEEGVVHIFENCDVYLKNKPTSHTVSVV